MSPGVPARPQVVGVPEPLVRTGYGQTVLWPLSSAFVTVNMASVKPTMVYRP
jgi:hypothetical protein